MDVTIHGDLILIQGNDISYLLSKHGWSVSDVIVYIVTYPSMAVVLVTS